jgi:hypothetical protein
MLSVSQLRRLDKKWCVIKEGAKRAHLSESSLQDLMTMTEEHSRSGSSNSTPTPSLRERGNVEEAIKSAIVSILASDVQNALPLFEENMQQDSSFQRTGLAASTKIRLLLNYFNEIIGLLFEETSVLCQNLSIKYVLWFDYNQIGCHSPDAHLIAPFLRDGRSDLVELLQQFRLIYKKATRAESYENRLKDLLMATLLFHQILALASGMAHPQVTLWILKSTTEPQRFFDLLIANQKIEKCEYDSWRFFESVHSMVTGKSVGVGMPFYRDVINRCRNDLGSLSVEYIVVRQSCKAYLLWQLVSSSRISIHTNRIRNWICSSFPIPQISRFSYGELESEVSLVQYLGISISDLHQAVTRSGLTHASATNEGISFILKSFVEPYFEKCEWDFVSPNHSQQTKGRVNNLKRTIAPSLHSSNSSSYRAFKHAKLAESLASWASHSVDECSLPPLLPLFDDFDLSLDLDILKRPGSEMSIQRPALALNVHDEQVSLEIQIRDMQTQEAGDLL